MDCPLPNPSHPLPTRQTLLYKSNQPRVQPNLVVLHAEQVVAVDFSAEAVRNSDRIQGPRSGCSYARGMMPDLSQMPPDSLIVRKVDPSLGSRFGSHLMTKHPVRIAWSSGNAQESMTLRVSDCEYEAFIANLRLMHGVRWPQVSRDE